MERVRLSLSENLRLSFRSGNGIVRAPADEGSGFAEVVTALWFWARGIPAEELPAALATLERRDEQRRARASRPMSDDSISRLVRRLSPNAPWPEKPTPRWRLEAEADTDPAEDAAT